jgi:hypothetical protein
VDVIREKPRLIRGTKTDDEFHYATAINPALEQWRVLAAEYVASRHNNKSDVMEAVRIFLMSYIHAQRLDPEPSRFLRSGYIAPCFYETCLKHFLNQHNIRKYYADVNRFIEYVLRHYFSVQDDFGISIIPSEFRNPIPPLPQAVDGHKGPTHESDKRVLPYHFVTQLRTMLCPSEAISFADWKWAQVAGDTNHGGSWFVVSSDMIDEGDPDCVFRIRPTTEYEKKCYGYGDSVHELWCPARAVALYLKLQLPLRTYQVRMLDSGEADSHRYVGGNWIQNTGPLARGTEKNPYRHGVFRRMMDDIRQVTMTGLYINTNKTADSSKEEWDRGYSIPWEHPEVLYWLEKLRNWQEKYNPIAAPIPWTELQVRHLGRNKAISALKKMGSTCFLFRDAATQGDDRFKPMGANCILEGLWYKLLFELERHCAARNICDAAGHPLTFIQSGTNRTTYYPLHSLRVSLITAYALEGGVPMTILSKCIAGHARLIMTLYYTKASITYCTEIMDAATKRLMANERITTRAG